MAARHWGGGVASGPRLASCSSLLLAASFRSAGLSEVRGCSRGLTPQPPPPAAAVDTESQGAGLGRRTLFLAPRLLFVLSPPPARRP